MERRFSATIFQEAIVFGAEIGHSTLARFSATIRGRSSTETMSYGTKIQDS